MNRLLLHLAVRLYPGAWRERYGVEFHALLDQTTPGWRDVLDVFQGGLQMHLRGVHPVLTAAAVGIVGACAAAAVAVSAADRFVSVGTMNVRRARPATEQTAVQIEDVMPRFAQDAFDQDTLTGIIERYDLYRGERARSSTGDLVHRMRGDIGIELVSPSVFQVSFTLSEGRTARQVTQELMSRLARSNGEVSGSIMQLVDPPDDPQVSISPQRVALSSVGGFGGGAMIGGLIGILRRRVFQRAV